MAPQGEDFNPGGKYESLRPLALNIDNILYMETSRQGPRLVFYGTDRMGLRWTGAVACEAIHVIPMGVLTDEAKEAIKSVDEAHEGEEEPSG